MLGSLYLALAKHLSDTGEMPNTNSPEVYMQRYQGGSGFDVYLHSVVMPDGNSSDGAGRSPNELVQTTTGPSISHTVDMGNRRKVARMLTTIADYLGTAGHGQFDDSGFRRGRAIDFPEVPGEVQRNRNLSQIRAMYNPGRDADGNLTPVSPKTPSRPHSASGSVQASHVSEIKESPSSLPHTHSALSVSPSGGKKRARRDTLEVPPMVHLPSRMMGEAPRSSSVTAKDYLNVT